MAKTNKKLKQQSFVRDYQKIMKEFPKPPVEQQWSSNGDFFVKFSLYNDIPSVPSTGTSILQS